jgi:cupin fold WbuC family metalloprotein
MTSMQGIDEALLDRLLDEARSNPRSRQNFNFHERADHPCQRLLNAVLPAAYIQPHRHLDPDKAEMLVVLRGRLGLVFFDAEGRVTGTSDLRARGPELAVNIPTGVFHTAVALDDGAVVFEAKAGPYRPHAPEERAPFAPADGAAEAPAYLATLKALFAGNGA